MREIEDHPVVISLSFVRTIGRDKAGYRVNLRCDCKQVGPVHMSSKRPTQQDCLRELGRLIQQDHGPICVEKKFKLGTRKYEEYKGVRFGNGDCALVVDVCLHRVDEDVSGLTFEE